LPQALLEERAVVRLHRVVARRTADRVEDDHGTRQDDDRGVAIRGDLSVIVMANDAVFVSYFFTGASAARAAADHTANTTSAYRAYVIGIRRRRRDGGRGRTHPARS
jgi:hypothetical protein